MSTTTKKPSRFDRSANSASDREAAWEKKAEMAKTFAGRTIGGMKMPPKIKKTKGAVTQTTVAQTIPAKPDKPWSGLKAGTAGLQFYARANPEERLSPQPWTLELVDLLLEASDKGKNYLCLVWPLRLPSIVLLHSMASAERNFATDLRGIRALLYPGTAASRNILNSALVNREQYSELNRRIWDVSTETSRVVSFTSSESFQALLTALNDIRIWQSDVPNPSLAEVIPAFIFNVETKQWETLAETPLERSLRKVTRLEHRRELRKRVNQEWNSLRDAPGALLVMRPGTKKEHWSAALESRELRGNGKPELFLFDALETSDSQRQKAIGRIPNFLSFARENGYQNTGSVTITDDPKTYFLLRSKMAELGCKLDCRVLAAEAKEPLLSNAPHPIGWVPEQKGNPRFSVTIVDRDASSVAMAFHRIARHLGNDDTPGHSELMEACFYVLRLSNMPAGYTDLTEMVAAEAAETGTVDYASQKSSWTTVELNITTAMAAGCYGAEGSNVEQTLQKARKLIDDWSDRTPMADRLLAEVTKYAVTSHAGISIVLPSQRYIALAHKYLSRKLGDTWAATEVRVGFITQGALRANIGAAGAHTHYTFVGITSEVLRILLSHPGIPHGTAVLIAYKQAEGILKTLKGMKEINEFKPYRGRIGLLLQDIEHRLAEIPHPIVIDRLGEIPLTFSLEDSGVDPTTEQHYYKYELDGAGAAYTSGWVYRFEPDEDPPFKRVGASTISSGDYIFEISDALRSKIEDALHIGGNEKGISGLPQRKLLKLYHQDIQNRCELFFPETNQARLARAIHEKMVSIDSSASDCLPRVNYWIRLNEGETTPHAPRDKNYFKIFCTALDISEQDAENYWGIVKTARRFNQHLGRVLAAQYSEILFRPESAAIYRKIPEAVIHALQQEALNCVYRVENVIPPEPIVRGY